MCVMFTFCAVLIDVISFFFFSRIIIEAKGVFVFLRTPVENQKIENYLKCVLVPGSLSSEDTDER